jgi:hypothetical protein
MTSEINSTQPERQAKTSKPWRFPALSEPWEHFLESVIFQITLPLAPIIIELLLTRDLSPTSANLAAAMYLITIGVASRSRALFALGVTGSIILASIYGWSARANHPGAAHAETPISMSIWIPVTSIGIMLSIHLIERYNRHVVDRMLFRP